MRNLFISIVCFSFLLASCDRGDNKTANKINEPNNNSPATDAMVTNTCTGVFPSYWQDPAAKFSAMWTGQEISNQAPAGWKGNVFRLSDAYPSKLVDHKKAQAWRDARFDLMFVESTSQKVKAALANEYAWLVMQYIQQGNINSGNTDTDWNVCENKVRPWFHIPFQTYSVMSGREFSHGLTREAPVDFSMQDPADPAKSKTLNGSMWAVAVFNQTAGYTLGEVWKPNGQPVIPTDDISFDDGAVVGKLLFNTSSPTDMPMMQNLPSWQAAISDPDFCGCKTETGEKCTMAEESQQCPRSTTKWGPVTLLQFDIAIKDHRAPGTKWVFATFVADGQRKAKEPNPWNRISPLGVMWGNDTPPTGQLASSYPESPRSNGFKQEVIFWDVVDMLNKYGGANKFQHPGHLGCNTRLNGPADKAYSSCMSCHMTASVADKNISVPALAAQFGGVTAECAFKDPTDPNKWIDGTGKEASEKNNITFAEMDSIYFADTDASAPFNTVVKSASGSKNIYPGKPDYADKQRKEWISLDFSLQLSISLVQWAQWQNHVNDKGVTNRIHSAVPPQR